MTDFVVGSAGECSVFLSDLSMKQLRSLREKMTGESRDRESRLSMEAAVAEAARKGVEVDIEIDGYLWCPADGPERLRRISLWICRGRQRSGERCPKSLPCDHKLIDVKRRRRRFMAKKKEGEVVEERVTKSSLLREAFDQKKEWTEEELLGKTGYDKSNLRIALAILRDPDRTKDPMYVAWDKVAKVFRKGSMKDAPPKREKKAKE